MNAIIKDQNILGTDAGLIEFLSLIENDVKPQFDEALRKHETSIDRWEAFVQTYNYLLQTVIL